MASELLNLTEIASHLNVSTERARQVANADPTFLAPSSEHPRRWKQRQHRALGRTALVEHAALEKVPG